MTLRGRWRTAGSAARCRRRQAIRRDDMIRAALIVALFAGRRAWGAALVLIFVLGGFMLRQADAASIGILRDIGIHGQGYGGFPNREWNCGKGVSWARSINLESKLGLMVPAAAGKQIIDTAHNQSSTDFARLEVFPRIKIGAFHCENVIHWNALLRENGCAGDKLISPFITNCWATKYLLSKCLLYSIMSMNVKKFTSNAGEAGWEMPRVQQGELQHNFGLRISYNERTSGNGIIDVNPRPIIILHFLELIAENVGLHTSNNSEYQRIYGNPPGEFGDRLFFFEPPWSVTKFFVVSTCIGFAGFIFLFGPYRRESLGAALFFLGLFLLLFGVFLGLRHGLLASADGSSGNIGVLPTIVTDSQQGLRG
jgi:hypothetical protein